MEVRIIPGETALTRMEGAYSNAADAVRAATAALDAAYGPSPAAGADANVEYRRDWLWRLGELAYVLIALGRFRHALFDRHSQLSLPR